METDEFFHSRREAFALRALPKIIAAFRRDAPQGRLQKAENTSCKLYTEQPHTAGYLRAEPDYKGYADRRYRGGRDRHEAGIHPGTDAPRLRALRHLYRRRSGTELRRGCGGHHTRTDTGKRTLRQKPHHRVGELPQPAAVLCRGHARYPHHDCRPREHHAPDKGVRERRSTQAGGQ